MPELPLHPTEPLPVKPAGGADLTRDHPAVPGPHSTPPSQRLRCPHCHNPIQLADGHSDEVLCPACGTAFQTREARPTVSAAAMRPLGKFQLLERVGVGGFGAVWKARDTTLDRIVALKIPHSGLLTVAADLERFQREARAAAQLRHPGIVPVHEVVMLEGLPTIVSDFVTGVPLKDLLETRRLSARESAALAASSADAVHYAHTMGVIHRDLKPANIIVPYASAPADASGRQVPQLERPLLMDFGLALRTEAEVTMTQDGHVLGTPAYMSPEQAAGRSHEADARSDVWGLGVVLYEVLTGELPFRGSKIMMLMQVMNDEPKPPRRLDARIPRDLETICLKCLRKEPAGRYATAADLAADLRRFLNGEPVLARRVGRTERLWRWCRRYPAVASLLATVALLLIAGTTVSTYFAIQADRRADEAEKSAERARQKEKEAEESREQAQVALARSWLGPLGLRKWQPLTEPEIAALWQVAEDRDERSRFRFVEEALRGPVTTRQLRNQAGFALQAAIGLGPAQHAAVERLLLERMQDPALGDEQRNNVALIAAAMDDLTPAAASQVAEILGRGLDQTNDAEVLWALVQGLVAMADRLERRDVAAAAEAVARAAGRPGVLQWGGIAGLGGGFGGGSGGADFGSQGLPGQLSELTGRLGSQDVAAVANVLTAAIDRREDDSALNVLIPGLSAVAERLEPKDAAATAARLTRVMSKTTDADALSSLAQGLSAVAARMESKEAARVSAEATAVLAQAMSKTNDPNGLSSLAQGLSAVAARMESKEAARVSAEAAAVLAQAMSKTTDTNALNQLAQGLSAVAARMESKEAARVSAEAAAVLAQAMSKTTDARALESLVQGLSEVAARLEAKGAADTAAVLAQAMSKTTDALPQLARGLSAVAARLETKGAAATAAVLVRAMSKTNNAYALPSLAQGLSAVAARMEPKEAARVSAEAAAVLAGAMGKATDANALNWLTQGLSALAARMESKEAARVSTEAAAVLAQAMSKTTDAKALSSLAQGLSAVAARMESKEAARVSAEAAAVLAQAMSKTTDATALYWLAESLSAVAVRLEARDATATAAVLAQAMSKTTDATALTWLAEGLSAVAARMESKEAARVSAEAAAVLTRAMSKTNDADALSSLAQGLSAVAARMESKEAARVSAEAAAVLAQAMSKTTNARALSSLARSLSGVAVWLKPQAAADVAATLTWAIGKMYSSGSNPLIFDISSESGEPEEIEKRPSPVPACLSAVLNGCEPPDISRRVSAVTGALGGCGGTGWPVASLALLGPTVEPLPCRLSTQQLVDLLKMPTCIGAGRRTVLDYLGGRYRRPFRDQWEFVEYARAHLPEIDLATPPKRPGR